MNDVNNPTIAELRVIVKTHCNLSCYFCHREGFYDGGMSSQLNMELYSEVLRLSLMRGLQKVHLTGGEPSLVSNLEEYVRIADEMGVKRIAITSNGTGLPNLLRALDAVPSLEINLSLPTLSHERFRTITNKDVLTSVIHAVEVIAARSDELDLNTVVTREALEELPQVLAMSSALGLRHKLLLLCQTPYVPAELTETAPKAALVLQEIGRLGYTCLDQANVMHRWSLTNAMDHTVIVQDPMCPGHCGSCADGVRSIRLLPNGFLRPCLLEEPVEKRFDRLGEIDSLLEAAIIDAMQCGKACDARQEKSCAENSRGRISSRAARADLDKRERANGQIKVSVGGRPL